MDIVKAINVGLKAAEKSVKWFKHRVRMGGGLGDTLMNYYLNSVVTYKLALLYLELWTDNPEREKSYQVKIER